MKENSSNIFLMNFGLGMSWLWRGQVLWPPSGGRPYDWIHIHSVFVSVMVKGADTWTWQRTCLSASTVVWFWDIGWGLFRWKFNTMVATGLPLVWLWWQAMRPLHSAWFDLTSKQYLHIHYIINMIQLLQCFHININMLPADQKAHDVTDRTDKSVTWSLTGQPPLALILSAGICGVYTFNACNRNMCFCCQYCTLQLAIDSQVQHSCIMNNRKENTMNRDNQLFLFSVHMRCVIHLL